MNEVLHLVTETVTRVVGVDGECTKHTDLRSSPVYAWLGLDNRSTLIKVGETLRFARLYILAEKNKPMLSGNILLISTNVLTY